MLRGFGFSSGGSTKKRRFASTLDLNGWWTNSYTGSGTWVGSSSVGPSSDRLLTANNYGLLTDGYFGPYYNGTSDVSAATPSTISNYVSQTDFTMAFLGFPVTAIATPGAGLKYTANAIMGNTEASIGLTSTGAYISALDSISRKEAFATATVLTQYTFILAQLAAGSLYISVNAAPFGAPVALTGGQLVTVSGAFTVGKITSSAYYSGYIRELIVMDTALSLPNCRLLYEDFRSAFPSASLPAPTW